MATKEKVIDRKIERTIAAATLGFVIIGTLGCNHIETITRREVDGITITESGKEASFENSFRLRENRPGGVSSTVYGRVVALRHDGEDSSECKPTIEIYDQCAADGFTVCSVTVSISQGQLEELKHEFDKTLDACRNYSPKNR